MIKLTFFIFVLAIFSGCVNKHGVSAKYYSDCEEYYDLQGYYHNDCGKDDVFTYKEAGEEIKEFFTIKKPPSKRNVW
jgi:hypothetical protein